MHRVAILIGLCACNQIFSLTQTQPIDARIFDVGIDAPFSCPPIGTVPQFSVLLHQDVPQEIDEYTISSTLMRAMGVDPVMGIVEGPIDAEAQHVIGGAAYCGTCTSFARPRLTPEGEGAYVLVEPPPTVEPRRPPFIAIYLRDNGSWTESVEFSTALLPLDGTEFISSVTRGPMRRMMIYASDGYFHEWALDDSGDASEIVPPYMPGDLGIAAESDPMLSSDGLRMVFQGLPADGDGTPENLYFYADRSDVTARVGTATVLQNVPPAAPTAYLNDDCSRIYVAGLGSLFYLQRE